MPTHIIMQSACKITTKYIAILVLPLDVPSNLYKTIVK